MKNARFKFRAWDKELYKMLYPEHCFLRINFRGELLDRHGVEIGNCELMQFTGLHDKNGKEIYESDLAKDSNGFIGEIAWHKERSSFIFHDSENYNESLFNKVSLEVIGNIYENTELLNSEQ